MFKVWDRVAVNKTPYCKPNFPLPLRALTITDISKCLDKTKECPKNCPGMIALDNKPHKCYAFEDTDPNKPVEYKLVLKHYRRKHNG